MTRPTLLFMCREGPRNAPKIFLRALLFSTAMRGWVVERLFIRLHQSGGSYLFDTWAYGERTDLAPGSGLFVGEQGIVFNHHFLPRSDASDFLFLDGDYRVEVYACLFGKKQPQKISEFRVSLNSQEAAELIQIMDASVFFEWDVDTEKYIGRIERRPQITR